MPFQNLNVPRYTTSTEISEKDFCKLIYDARHFPQFGKIEGVSSQLNPSVWVEELRNSGSWDPDVHYLLDGVVHGFRMLDADACVPSYVCENYSSCFKPQVKKSMNCLISEEISSGKLSVVEKKPNCIHAMGAIAKEDCKICPITDCKRPLGTSVNLYTSNVFTSFEFVKFDEILSMVQKGSFMATTDLKSAYRSVMIHPSNRTFFGLKWEVDGESQFLVDNFICFGAKVAPGCFSRLTDSVVRMMKSRNITCYSYLDDFICISPTWEECQRQQLILIRLLRSLGFYISWAKVTSPSKKCKFLGIMIDSDQMCLSLPQKKKLRLNNVLLNWKKRVSVSKLQLQKLLGFLSHCAKVIKGGRLYLGRLIDFLNTVPETGKIPLSEGARMDLIWWGKFCEREELIIPIVTEFQWVRVAVIRWGDILTKYRNTRVRLAVGPHFYFGNIIWDDTLEVKREGEDIVWTLPSDCRGYDSVTELLLLLEGVKILGIHSHTRYCFAYKNALNIFRSGLSEFEWIRDYLKLKCWDSVFKGYELSSVYISCNSARLAGPTGGGS